MGTKETSDKRAYRQSCRHCRKIKKGCEPSEFDPRTCVNCHKAGMECSLSVSRTTPSTDAKRKIEEIQDTPERESFRTNRASSSITASHNPHDPPIEPTRKKPRQGKRAQPVTHNRIPPREKKKKISPDACGICLKESCSLGEKQGDAVMLECDIESCPTWYHLSCVQFTKDIKQIFYSLATGTDDTIFMCINCCNPMREDLANAAAKATSDFTEAMKRINQAARAEKEGWPQTFFPSPPQEDITYTSEQNAELLQLETPGTTDFEPARDDKYQGFEREKIDSLLSCIELAVYDYDRDISCANQLFRGGNDVVKETPLKVWNEIDPGQHFLSGKDWFDINGTANNLSESHAPITAALRRMLKTPDDKLLQISSDLKDITFSQVHIALINWFVFDLLSNKLNIYLFPNMKPLRATLAAVANFGDARWKGNGRQVVREVQLRAWHKTQFREEVVENVGWQGELIHRLEAFLEPLTKNIGKLDPWCPSRANIIKHTIELWSYLEAANGRLEIIQPTIGGTFDGRECENIEDELQSGGMKNMKVKWVVRRGFRFREGGMDGKTMPTKALVIVN